VSFQQAAQIVVDTVRTVTGASAGVYRASGASGEPAREVASAAAG
jgi:hypothetical protein